MNTARMKFDRTNLDRLLRGANLHAVVARGFALALLATLVVVIGRTYVGHSPGPYGVCYGNSGRAIPCAVAHDK